ncbi:MAG TPA: ATP-dependent RecD-like DNA helicase [Aggregatilineales bacterium]|nr:ATP-dependent RecD-like DNA helicase [Aggregatilineales bacterium]
MPSETIEGVVEAIIFRNDDSGWTVLSLAVNSGRSVQADETVVVGKFTELQPGETVRFSGSWTVHKEYGEQFKADSMHLVTTTQESVETILSSGIIEGIGRQTAMQILKHFGTNAIDILDADPERIHEVNSIPTKRATIIATSWAEQRGSRTAMVFLQKYGITAALAHRIYETYGDETIKTIQDDPYKLALDIEGFDFKAADQIARGLGLSPESLQRAKAGVLFALTTLSSEGHVYSPRPLLIEKTASLLDIPEEVSDSAISALLRNREVISIKSKSGPSGNIEVIYSLAMFDDETGVAEQLKALAATKSPTKKKAKVPDWPVFFEKLAKDDKVTLSAQQQDAVRAAVEHKLSVLTGGPGTGKTTTLRAVIQALDVMHAEYLLASPTGRAARRLNEATQRPASTIHRLLGYSEEGGFAYDESNPLDGDVVIVDEASMLDLGLFARLLDAMPPTMRLMLVGDVDQLPSVGAGDVLRDVIASGLAHVTRLDFIFRQSSDSHVALNAHRINKGEMPDLSNASSDFFMFGVPEGEGGSVLDLVVDVVRNRIPTKFGLDPLNDVQVLAPMYKGDVGIHALNERLQAVLNPVGRNVDHRIGERTFRIGDKVIQTRNNYEKDVYNGDIGRILGIDPVEQEIEIDMDGRIVTYAWKETADLFHAFAISVHRSQGSEYPAVVIPTVPQFARMLQRNLLYTAITRAKKLVVLVGSRRAIQMAVENDRVAHRYSGLVWHIQHSPDMP